MTTSDDLASIEKVELRKVWDNEAQDFTPWLAKAENLSKLGDALDLDLALRALEAPVGDFSLDILAHDLGSDKPVVIENQLEQTDHTHLGQLLTYAAGFDAKVIVWIAEEFRDEHREALDLLNHRTGEDTQFFGVEVELWKIDDSRPAVNFKLVATPNDWRKQAVNNARAAGNVSEKGEQYQRFFQKLIDTLKEEHDLKAKKAGTANWKTVLSEYGASVSYRAILAAGKARFRLYIDSDKEWNENLFDTLERQKESIESELGESLEWELSDGNIACHITAVREGSINDDEETLEEIRKWMIARFLTFRDVFGPRIDAFVSN